MIPLEGIGDGGKSFCVLDYFSIDILTCIQLSAGIESKKEEESEGDYMFPLWHYSDDFFRSKLNAVKY